MLRAPKFALFTAVLAAAFAAPRAAGATLVNEITQNGALDIGEGVAVSFCITNPDPTPTPSLTGTLQASGNVFAPSGPQRYGSLAPGETVCRTYTFPSLAPVACRSSPPSP